MPSFKLFIVNQYFFNLQLNGDESLEKNLVFSLGIQLAYNAFKNFGKDYYPLRAQGEFYESKLFFLSFSHVSGNNCKLHTNNVINNLMASFYHIADVLSSVL